MRKNIRMERIDKHLEDQYNFLMDQHQVHREKRKSKLDRKREEHKEAYTRKQNKITTDW